MIGQNWKITKVIGGISIKMWASSGGALLICFIFYCFYGTIVAVSILGIFTFGILYHFQDSLLFYPELPSNSRTLIQIPAMHNLPYETVTIRTIDKCHLHAFWVRQPADRCKFSPTIIFFHGNAGNMGHRLQNVWGFYNHLHCNILMMEYRGYGLSTGTPSEKGFYIDGRSALDYLYTRDDLNHREIILFGRSLGGAVVIQIASEPNYQNRIMSVIVENTFTSIQDMAKILLHPYIRFVPSFCYKNKFNSIKKIGNIKAPVLFISGLKDTLVPPTMMRQLFSKCTSPKKHLFELCNGQHNDTWVCEGYYSGIAAFIEDCRCKSKPLQMPPSNNDIWKSVQDV